MQENDSLKPILNLDVSEWEDHSDELVVLSFSGHSNLTLGHIRNIQTHFEKANRAKEEKNGQR